MAVLSQNGWPVKEAESANWILPQISGRVLAGPVWVVLFCFARQFNDRVEKIDKLQSWGWTYRKIAGSVKWSNHASGTAVDFNATVHPQKKSGTFSSAQVAEIRKILKAFGGVLRWGDGFSPVDEMHFEIAPGVTEARVQKMATMLLQEQLLKRKYDLGKGRVDGIRGPKTLAALKQFQTDAKLTVDGIDGPKTWAALVS